MAKVIRNIFAFETAYINSAAIIFASSFRANRFHREFQMNIFRELQYQKTHSLLKSHMA